MRLFFTHGSSEDVDVVFRRLGRHHLLAAILEARRAPRAAYLPALRRVWWSLEAEVRSDFDQSPAEEPQPYVLACADATAAALGACAARDPDYRDFSADQTHRTELEELYRKHREHVEEHNRLVEAYKAGHVAAGMILPASEDEPVVEMIKNLRRMIEASEHHLRQAEVRYRDRMSPGFILWRILADAQGYPIAVRQGAAHGLYQLLADGHLDDAAREEVFELLRTAVSGEDARDFGERRVRLPAAADRTELRASLADGLQWMLDLMEGIGERWQRQWRATLARRGETSPEARPAVDPLLAAMKRLQPGAEDVEPEEAVDGPRPPAGPPSEPPGLGNAGEGASAEASPAAADEEAGTPAERLALFDQLLAEDRPSVEERFPRLDEIAGGLIERLPGAVAFLQRYPLRLMRRDHQRALFGLYAKQPIRVQLWTRYTPPKNAGPVHRRYLALDDRSTPNSMGIAYPLFRHPLLALPVVYHEYLHYGGTTGDPENGIGNETEVLLREILFARRLIAELAPAEDDRLGDFERQLIDEIRAVGLDPLLPQLLCDLRRDDVLEAINRSVLATYGERLDAEQARRQAEVQIHLENVGIELSNRTLTWDPQIRWPHLGSESTRELTDRFRRVLVASRRIDHRVSRAQRDAVLQDADSAAASTAWQSYRRRAGAGVALAAAHPPVFTPLTIIRLLAQVREPLAA
ncbi:MAG: hypothetical protein D6696_08600 [Acidobacteria bacterium]|nr:MAG: hypothetical protein D6696_08600 [Acidobacteriota bacterium]